MKLDVHGTYNLVRIQQGEALKTAVWRRYSHFEYLVMSFGLCNASATFQHFTNNVFCNIFHKFVMIHLDYVLIFFRKPRPPRVHHCRSALPQSSLCETQDIWMWQGYCGVSGLCGGTHHGPLNPSLNGRQPQIYMEYNGFFDSHFFLPVIYPRILWPDNFYNVSSQEGD